MPTYQYACTECGHDFETVQSFTDPALTECPQCSGRLRKVFNSVGIVFKGTGFYRTDSREGAKAKDKATADSGGDKGATDKSSGDKGSPDSKSSKADSTSPSTSSTPAPASTSSSSSTKGSAA